MVFKNEEQLKSFLLQKCKNALIKSQEQVYQIINRFVKEFYAEYNPECMREHINYLVLW